MLKLESTPLRDCFILKPELFEDHRGTFMENFSQKRFQETTGLRTNFVQDNQSTSTRGVLRGLHFQKEPYGQAKLVRAVVGEILDVVVDLRPGSSTYKKSFKMILSASNNLQLYVPAGFAHGFLTRSETSVFSYKCDEYYNREADAGLIWNDPTFDIDWEFPEDQLILSEKDAGLPTFEQYTP